MASSVNLTNVIEKYQKSVKHVSGTTEKEIFTNFYDKINRNFIHIWVNNTFNKTSVKCEQKSTDFRYKGNRNFLLGNFDEAIKNYTESLNFSPCNSENYAFALAHRSAIFLIKKDYKSCISDTEVCLEHYCPEKIKYKIYLRLIRSYLKLFFFDKALKCINMLKFHLENEHKDLSDAQKDKINSEFIEIQTEISEKEDLGRTDMILATELDFDQNNNFKSASNLISLQYSDLKGRHVTAAQDIKMGEILFIESPFAFVPVLLEDPSAKIFCYHCFVPTVCPIPCKDCKTQFCSQKCFNDSWDAYHQFECTGSCVEIWPQIGVNYLAVRMLILGARTGYKNVFNVKRNGVEQFGVDCDNYDYVCSLITNLEKMDKFDIFPHVVSAVIFTTYLLEKTSFPCYVLKNMNNMGRATPKKWENLPYIIGSVLLKHILQVISNAATIESVKDEFYKLFNSTEQISDNGHYFSGAGLYPSCSMMNHSCDPNITNYYMNDVIIIKAKFDIKKGAEIYNSYGYDCRRQLTIDRKDELKKQHYFDCDCTACTFPTKPEMYNEGLLCQNCKGLSLAKNNIIYTCLNCKREFDAKNHFLYINKARTLFEKWERTKNIAHLIRCLELREKVFYKYNFFIYTTNLELQTCYEEKGDMQLWWVHMQKTLELDTEILGENSLRSAMNLRYSLLTLLKYLTSLSLERKNHIPKLTLIQMLDEVKIMFETMKKMFVLYYNNNVEFQEIHDLIEDAGAIVTFILGEHLYINTLEEALKELCAK